MLGVAIARSASAAGRRWPGPGEAVSLIVSGLGKRLGAAVPRDGVRDLAAWLDAAAVLTVIGPVLLAAATARSITRLVFLYSDPHDYPYLPAQTWAVGQAAGWALVALLACLGLRRLAAFGAVGLPALLGLLVQLTYRIFRAAAQPRA